MSGPRAWAARHPYWAALLVLLVLVVLGPLVAPRGPDTQPAARTPAPPPAAPTPTRAPVTATVLPGVGTAVAGRNWTYRVTAVDLLPADQRLIRDAAVGRWLWVALAVTNTGRANFALHDWDFAVRDGRGNRYDATDRYGAAAEALAATRRRPLGGQVPPGSTVETGLLFDVAPGAADLRLELVQEQRTVLLGV